MSKAEKKVKKKKDAVDPNVQHVFYVTDIQFWQVTTIRYVLVKRTAKYVEVLDSTAKKKRLVADDADGRVCDTYKEAREYAKARIKEKSAKLKEYKKNLEMSKQELKVRAIRDVVPRTLRISSKDYKF